MHILFFSGFLDELLFVFVIILRNLDSFGELCFECSLVFVDSVSQFLGGQVVELVANRNLVQNALGAGHLKLINILEL